MVWFNILWVFISVSLFAGPPMISDDPFIIDKNSFELNSAVLLTTSRNSNDVGSVLDLSYAPLESLQLNVVSSYDLGSNTIDLSEVALKYQLFKSEHVYVALQPRYISADFTYESFSSLFLPIEFAYVDESYMIIAEVGYVQEDLYGANERSLSYGAHYTQIFDDFDISIELHNTSYLPYLSDSVQLNVGTTITLNEHVSLLMSMGSDIINEREERQLFSYLGVGTIF